MSRPDSSPYVEEDFLDDFEVDSTRPAQRRSSSYGSGWTSATRDSKTAGYAFSGYGDRQDSVSLEDDSVADAEDLDVEEIQLGSSVRRSKAFAKNPIPAPPKGLVKANIAAPATKNKQTLLEQISGPNSNEVPLRATTDVLVDDQVDDDGLSNSMSSTASAATFAPHTVVFEGLGGDDKAKKKSSNTGLSANPFSSFANQGAASPRNSTTAIRIFERVGARSFLGVGLENDAASGVSNKSSTAAAATPYVVYRYRLWDGISAPQGVSPDQIKRLRSRLAVVDRVMSSNPHCITCAGTASSGDYLYIAFQYAAGGSLRRYVKRLKERHQALVLRLGKGAGGAPPPVVSRPVGPALKSRDSYSSDSDAFEDEDDEDEVEVRKRGEKHLVVSNAFSNNASSPNTSTSTAARGIGLSGGVHNTSPTLSERNAAMLLRQLVSVVASLHRQGQIHGAISANTVLFDCTVAVPCASSAEDAQNQSIFMLLGGFAARMLQGNRRARSLLLLKGSDHNTSSSTSPVTGGLNLRALQSPPSAQQQQQGASGGGSERPVNEDDLCGIGDVLYEICTGLPPVAETRAECVLGGPPAKASSSDEEPPTMELFRSAVSKQGAEFLKLCWSAKLLKGKTGGGGGEDDEGITIRHLWESRFIATAPTTSQSVETLEMEEHAATKRHAAAVECVKYSRHSDAQQQWTMNQRRKSQIDQQSAMAFQQQQQRETSMYDTRQSGGPLNTSRMTGGGGPSPFNKTSNGYGGQPTMMLAKLTPQQQQNAQPVSLSARGGGAGGFYGGGGGAASPNRPAIVRKPVNSNSQQTGGINRMTIA